MSKGYWVVSFHSIQSPEKVEAYRDLAGPALLAFGAKFLARGLPDKVAEQGKMERVVLIEFADLQKALDAHESSGYQEALKALDGGAIRDLRIIEGL